MTTISVVIPAFNSEKTILETLQSILNQTFQDFEIIVINDGSTDGTLEVLNQVNDPRLKVFSYENAGVAIARNRGISHAQGKFISFIDADDLWTPEKLESQLEILQNNPSAGVAYSWTLNMYDDGQSLSFSQGCASLMEGDIHNDLLLSNFIGSGSAILARREAVDRTQLFDPKFVPCEDWQFYLQLSTFCSFVVVPKNQILYRKASGTQSSKVTVMERAGLCVIDWSYQALQLKSKYPKSRSLAYLYRYCADLSLTHVFDSDSTKMAYKYLLSAIKIHPQILLESYAQRLIIKLMLKQLLPKRISDFTNKTLRKLLSAA